MRFLEGLVPETPTLVFGRAVDGQRCVPPRRYELSMAAGAKVGQYARDEWAAGSNPLLATIPLKTAEVHSIPVRGAICAEVQV